MENKKILTYGETVNFNIEVYNAETNRQNSINITCSACKICGNYFIGTGNTCTKCNEKLKELGYTKIQDIEVNKPKQCEACGKERTYTEIHKMPLEAKHLCADCDAASKTTKRTKNSYASTKYGNYKIVNLDSIVQTLNKKSPKVGPYKIEALLNLAIKGTPFKSLPRILKNEESSIKNDYNRLINAGYVKKNKTCYTVETDKVIFRYDVSNGITKTHLKHYSFIVNNLPDWNDFAYIKDLLPSLKTQIPEEKLRGRISWLEREGFVEKRELKDLSRTDFIQYRLRPLKEVKDEAGVL